MLTSRYFCHLPFGQVVSFNLAFMAIIQPHSSQYFPTIGSDLKESQSIQTSSLSLYRSSLASIFLRVLDFNDQEIADIAPPTTRVKPRTISGHYIFYPAPLTMKTIIVRAIVWWYCFLFHYKLVDLGRFALPYLTDSHWAPQSSLE